MSRDNVRRLAILAFTLYCLTYLTRKSALSFLAVARPLMPSHRWPDVAEDILSGGWSAPGSAALTGAAWALVPVLCLAVLIWLVFRHGAAVGRVFAPSSLDGGAMFGCAALRVLCLRPVIVGSVSGAQWVVESLAQGARFSTYGLEWPAWCAYYFFVPAVSLLLFFAAPWIAKWVVRQVDTGVMWWSPMIRWMTR